MAFENALFPMAALGGLFAGFMVAMVVFVLAAYVYTSLAIMTIAHKTGTPNAWLAWIPIANFFLLTQIADVPWWTLLIALFGSFVPYLGPLAVGGISVWWWWRIAEVRGKPGWFSLLMLIPFVNFVIIGVLAWSD